MDNKTKEFFIEYIETMSEDKFDKLVNKYLDALHSENIFNINYFKTYEGKKWSDISKDDIFYYKSLGWNKDNFNSNTKPKAYNKKWSELSLDERNSALILGYNCSIWDKKECSENPFKKCSRKFDQNKYDMIL